MLPPACRYRYAVRNLFLVRPLILSRLYFKWVHVRVDRVGASTHPLSHQSCADHPPALATLIHHHRYIALTVSHLGLLFFPPCLSMHASPCLQIPIKRVYAVCNLFLVRLLILSRDSITVFQMGSCVDQNSGLSETSTYHGTFNLTFSFLLSTHTRFRSPADTD